MSVFYTLQALACLKIIIAVAEKRKKAEKIIGFLDFIMHEICLLC